VHHQRTEAKFEALELSWSVLDLQAKIDTFSPPSTKEIERAGFGFYFVPRGGRRLAVLHWRGYRMVSILTRLRPRKAQYILLVFQRKFTIYYYCLPIYDRDISKLIIREEAEEEYKR
jgi:hypothetical protein